MRLWILLKIFCFSWLSLTLFWQGQGEGSASWLPSGGRSPDFPLSSVDTWFFLGGMLFTMAGLAWGFPLSARPALTPLWLGEVGVPPYCSSCDTTEWGVALSPLGSGESPDCPLGLPWHHCCGKAGAASLWRQRGGGQALHVVSLHWVQEGGRVTSSGDEILGSLFCPLTPPWQWVSPFAFYIHNGRYSLKKEPSRLSTLAWVGVGLQFFSVVFGDSRAVFN